LKPYLLPPKNEKNDFDCGAGFRIYSIWLFNEHGEQVIYFIGKYSQRWYTRMQGKLHRAPPPIGNYKLDPGPSNENKGFDGFEFDNRGIKITSPEEYTMNMGIQWFIMKGGE